MRVNITRSGQFKHIVLIEVRVAFMEMLRVQARVEGTTPAKLIEEAVLSIVPAESPEAAARNRRYS